jgi:hypothetical protein
MINILKKQKKEVKMEEKREKTINNFIMKKYPKSLDKTKCNHVDESFKNEFFY